MRRHPHVWPLRMAIVLAVTGAVMSGCAPGGGSQGLTVDHMASLATNPAAAVSFFSDMSDQDIIQVNIGATSGSPMTSVGLASHVGDVLDQRWSDNGNSAGHALIAAGCPESGQVLDQTRSQIGTQLLVAVAARRQADHQWVPAPGVALAITRITGCNMASVFRVSPRAVPGNPDAITWPDAAVAGHGAQDSDGSWLVGVNAVVLGTALQVAGAAGQNTDAMLAAWQDQLPAFFAANIGTDQQSITDLYLNPSSQAVKTAQLSGCVLSFITNNAIAGTRDNSNLSSLGAQIERAGWSATSAAYAAFVQALANAGYFTQDVINAVNGSNKDFLIPDPPAGLQPGSRVNMDDPEVANWLQTSLVSHPATIITAVGRGNVDRFVAAVP